MTLTPVEVAWVWDDEEKLREHARGAAAALREANEKPSSRENTAVGLTGDSNEMRPSKYPYKITFENFSRSQHPEDLIEFKRRLSLFGQMVREELASRERRPIETCLEAMQNLVLGTEPFLKNLLLASRVVPMNLSHGDGSPSSQSRSARRREDRPGCCRTV